MPLDPRLLEVGLELAPEVIDWFKTQFAKKHPDVPPPTDAEVIAGLNVAFVSSLARDEAWLSAHPE